MAEAQGTPEGDFRAKFDVLAKTSGNDPAQERQRPPALGWT